MFVGISVFCIICCCCIWAVTVNCICNKVGITLTAFNSNKWQYFRVCVLDHVYLGIINIIVCFLNFVPDVLCLQS